MSLSRRAEELAKPDPRYQLWDVVRNNWSPTMPEGIVNLGVAENDLMVEEMTEHIHKHLDLPPSAFTYGDGGQRLKKVLAGFLTRKLKARTPIEPAHITLTNGCSSAIEHLSWALANPGDVMLLGRPHYATFVDDVTLRMGAVLTTVAFRGLDPLGVEGVRRYEEAILETQRQGRRVAAVIISNPHNPLGRCYPREALIALLELCQRYKVHFISDEIYALSTFTNTVDAAPPPVAFESCLSLPLSNIIDPALVHVVWGTSKDFGANGLRVGALVSQANPTLHAAIVPVSLYSSTSSLAEHAAADFLGDEAWAAAYVRENQARLARSYERVTAWAREEAAEYAPGVTAAFFLWVDLGAAYRRAHPELGEGEDIYAAVSGALMRQKVFLASGVQFGSEESGWFRIVFSHQAEYLEEGLRRITAAIRAEA
ncbi:1-aminocyclopropane-1-carboxylate synthase-like protein 1 [Paramyrothecium foliicola]|nr:1-aminocyclopropane-1-carboxylate synthase-like protein 1 [Paramyrothecium foliicola]